MYTITKQIKFVSLLSILSLFQLSIVVAESGYGGPYGFGSPADPKLIKKWDIARRKRRESNPNPSRSQRRHPNQLPKQQHLVQVSSSQRQVT